MSELLYEEYIITGESHATQDNELTYYFALDGLVVYIENVDNSLSHKQTSSYVNFIDPTFDDKRSRTASAAGIFYASQPTFMINRAINLDKTSLFEYKLTPLSN